MSLETFLLEKKALKLKKADLEKYAWDILKNATARFYNMIAIQQAPDLAEAQKAILVKTVELLQTVISARECCTDLFSDLLAL